MREVAKQRAHPTWIAIALLALTSAMPERGAAQTSTPSQPAHVEVGGVDYAFVQLPTTLAAGPTLFAFENRGSKRHEMSIALLKPGLTLDAVIAAGTSISGRAVSDSILGLLIARPGDRSGGQLYANLISGRTYIVVCSLKDTPDARPHIELGMFGSFKVR